MYLIVNFFNMILCNSFFLKIVKYIIIQNMISIALLPIYSSWGISFSLISIFGNFIFLPFLMIYLFLSIGILFLFFFDYVFFSFIYLQKYVLDMWIFIMQMIEKTFSFQTICFVNYPLFSYPMCFIVLIFLFFLKKKVSSILLFFYSSLFFVILLFIFSYLPPRSSIKIIQDNDRTYLIRYLSNQKVFLHFFGRAFKKKSFEKKIKYIILPEIKKNFGIQYPFIIM